MTDKSQGSESGTGRLTTGISTFVFGYSWKTFWGLFCPVLGDKTSNQAIL